MSLILIIIVQVAEFHNLMIFKLYSKKGKKKKKKIKMKKNRKKETFLKIYLIKIILGLEKIEKVVSHQFLKKIKIVVPRYHLQQNVQGSLQSRFLLFLHLQFHLHHLLLINLKKVTIFLKWISNYFQDKLIQIIHKKNQKILITSLIS